MAVLNGNQPALSTVSSLMPTSCSHLSRAATQGDHATADAGFLRGILVALAILTAASGTFVFASLQSCKTPYSPAQRCADTFATVIYPLAE
jgi:hypothetical protein